VLLDVPNNHDYPIHSDREPKIPHSKTIELIRVYQSDPERNNWAKSAAIRGNLGLVRQLATKFRANSSQEYLDFVQDGVLGLDNAIRRFNLSRGLRFSTYATFWVMEAISSSIAWNGRVIRLPEHEIARQNKIRKFIQDGRKTNPGFSPSHAEIATGTGAKVFQVERSLVAGLSVAALDRAITDGPETLLELTPGESRNDGDTLNQQQTREYLERALAKVDPHDRDILFQSIGAGCPKIPLRTISANHGRVGTRYATQRRDNAINQLRVLVDRDAIGW
jgi:RNA polymerase sigma factor (sigma-70 family)